MLVSYGELSPVRWDSVPIGMSPDLEQQIGEGVTFGSVNRDRLPKFGYCDGR